MYDLNHLIPATLVWVLQAAYGINDAGQVIGSGIQNGQAHAFRLDPMANLQSAAPAVLADVNGDGKVDCSDIAMVKAVFGNKSGQPGFEPRADGSSRWSY